jgi:hypothetical protein
LVELIFAAAVFDSAEAGALKAIVRQQLAAIQSRGVASVIADPKLRA